MEAHVDKLAYDSILFYSVSLGSSRPRPLGFDPGRVFRPSIKTTATSAAAPLSKATVHVSVFHPAAP
jgi:hypothetical protein